MKLPPGFTECTRCHKMLDELKGFEEFTGYRHGTGELIPTLTVGTGRYLCYKCIGRLAMEQGDASNE